jgi:chitin disaccharide deacetylase
MRPGARVLLVNADDFGIYPAANAAVIDAIDHGIAASCSVMVIAPGAPEALRMLADRPDIAFGVHLTLVTDFPDQRWSTRTHGRSLLDASGRMFGSDDRAGLLRSARIAEVEAEFRAQVELVLDAGLTPTHLDWHCLADGGRPDVFDVTLVLADEYGVAVRGWLEPARRTLRARRQPVVDHDFLDSFSMERPGKAARYVQLLRDLPVGLTEWAVHPAFADAGDSSSWVRRTDHEFLVSAQAREVVEEEGITVIGWSTVLEQWRHAGGPPA